MTLLKSYLFASAILLLPGALGFFSWYVNIQAGWCNNNLQECATTVCGYLGFGFCSDSIRIRIRYDEITPHLCNICNKRCKRVPRDDGRYDDRLPCTTTLDCLMGQKCKDGGCWNWKQFKNCTSDWQCDRRQYSCQSFECRLRPEAPPAQTRSVLGNIFTFFARIKDAFGKVIYNNDRGSRRRCTNAWDRDCLPVVQGVSCTRNSHCGYDYICYNGQCILHTHKPKHCYDDRDCDNGYICRDRECVFGSRTGTTKKKVRKSCERNSQCSFGQRCLNLECVNDNRRTTIVSVGGSCDSTSDCPSGQRCHNFICENANGGRQTQKPIRKSCERSNQCPSGQRCLNLECVNDNRRTTTISTGGSCDSSSDCPSGQRCRNFVCEQ